MKIRSIRMREAHRQVDDETVSFCSIIWDNGAQHIVTSSSSDPSILIHDSLLLSSTPKKIRQHSDGVTALALSPNSTCLASASKDRSVKLYKFPGGDFDTNITRFTLPIRAIAFNGSGCTLAAAGDDEGIKLINAIDGSIARVLKGHNGSVTGLSFDPNGEYMSSVDSVGTVIFWELNSGKALHVLTSVAPKLRSDSSVTNTLSWSPDGETLAVPGLRNDVVMYDRDTAEKLFTLRGDHVEPVCSISWSPNGKYIATSGSDKQVLVWDVEKREDIDRQKFSNVICSMSWKPVGNALSIIDVKGNYSVWEAPVPLSMKSPTEDLPSKSKNNNGYQLFTEEEKEEEEEEEEDSIPGGQTPKKKRRLDLDDEMSEENAVQTPNSKMRRPRKPSPISSVFVASKPTMQEAFQPGSTPKQSGKRHFLCYNMVGSITSMEQNGYSHVEVDFHDTGISPRIPSMTDYSGFTMASMNQSGSVFGSPSNGEKTMSTLMYRPFSSWANNSEWSVRFDDELRAVALGSGWVAAVTSSNHLHIFTEGGLQKHVISLNGTIVTSSGLNEKIAVAVAKADTQSLEFQVFDIFRRTLSFQGSLPLSPGSILTWLGFSEEGRVASHDSKGVLRVYEDHFGGCWVPMFSTKRFSESEGMCWAVGLNESKFFCIIPTGTTFPQVVPKPVLTPVDLSLPLPVSDLGAETLENEFMMREMRLWRIRGEIDRASDDADTVAMEDEAFDMEAALDRCILRLIASCCNGDRLVRATELVRCLSLEKSVRGAVKLATALKLPSLAERFSGILEERISEVAHAGGGDCVKVVESDIKREEKGREPECVPSTPVVPPLNTLSIPSFMKKKNKEGGDESDGGLMRKASPTEKVQTSLKQRPSNPFAKDSSSINKGKFSFFESIKKTKGVADSTHE